MGRSFDTSNMNFKTCHDAMQDRMFGYPKTYTPYSRGLVDGQYFKGASTSESDGFEFHGVKISVARDTATGTMMSSVKPYSSLRGPLNP